MNKNAKAAYFVLGLTVFVLLYPFFTIGETMCQDGQYQLTTWQALQITMTMTSLFIAGVIWGERGK